MYWDEIQPYFEQVQKLKAARALEQIEIQHSDSEALTAKRKQLINIISPAPPEIVPDGVLKLAEVFGTPQDVERIRLERKYLDFMERQKNA